MMDHEILNCPLCLSMTSSYNYTLSGCQPVRLDHDGRLGGTKFSTVEILQRHIRRLSDTISRGRHLVPGHKIFRKYLAALESSRSSTRPNNPQSFVSKQIDDSGGERRFGP